ncbi:MAG TPA: hypothetical protein VJG66_01085 [Patescibacteria group bacterium]|nr:hypothetical protein [Patescibacteria group bacterium]
MTDLPQSVKVTLWSYDLNKIDREKHKKLIISQVLNFGSLEAVSWLFANYSGQEIKEAALNTPLGAWDKKSLNLWSLFLNLDKSQFKNRFI